MSSDSPTNVIYIVCHDLGRHLGCYGRKVKSPNLDRFAAEGILFQNAYCNTAVCSPSRGACMSGMYAHNNGIMGLTHFGWRYFEGVKTVVDYFIESGFETVHCGFSHEGEECASRYQIDYEVTWRCQLVEAAVDDALAYLRGRKRQGNARPFYLNVGCMEAHKSIWEKDKDEDGVPSRFHRVYGGKVSDDEVAVPPPTPDVPHTHNEFARFEAAIRYMDRQLGRLLDEIEVLGYGEDTLVVFSTDHGMVDLRGKGSMYGRGTEIALLARPPKRLRKPGMVVKHLIQNIDYTPTFLEAAGIPVAPALQGRSFQPILAETGYMPHEQIFTEWNFGGPQQDFSPIRAVRTPSHLYIRHYGPHNYGYYRPEEIGPDFTNDQMQAKRFKHHGGPYQHPERFLPAEELFDLETDPYELCNVAADPAYQTVLGDLSARVDEWMKSTDDYVLRGETPVIPAEAGWRFPQE